MSDLTVVTMLLLNMKLGQVLFSFCREGITDIYTIDGIMININGNPKR